MKEVVNYIKLARVRDGERSDSRAGGEILEDLLKTGFHTVCFRCGQHSSRITDSHLHASYLATQQNFRLQQRCISTGQCDIPEQRRLSRGLFFLWGVTSVFEYFARNSYVEGLKDYVFADFGFHVFIPTALINGFSDTSKRLYMLVTITSRS